MLTQRPFAVIAKEAVKFLGHYLKTYHSIGGGIVGWPSVRIACAEALGDIGGSEARSALKDVIKYDKIPSIFDPLGYDYRYKGHSKVRAASRRNLDRVSWTAHTIINLLILLFSAIIGIVQSNAGSLSLTSFEVLIKPYEPYGTYLAIAFMLFLLLYGIVNIILYSDFGELFFPYLMFLIASFIGYSLSILIKWIYSFYC